ncbi:MAG TPA: MoaD/ThiS family protein [Burkholderiales bacterium]|nr:MoaD/ThiS family protein [Burkholderiales bacterium]
MKIKFKLFANLADFLPQPSKTNSVELEVAAGSTIQSVIEQFRLPSQLVHLVLVNGLYVYPTARVSTKLKEGDVLAIWPPIAGG